VKQLAFVFEESFLPLTVCCLSSPVFNWLPVNPQTQEVYVLLLPINDQKQATVSSSPLLVKEVKQSPFMCTPLEEQ